MKPLLLTICLGSHVCFLGFGAGGHDKTPPNVLTEAEKKEGWKLLFDGKSLDGWMSWRTRKPLEASGWRVIDGTLHHEKGGGDIYTAQAFESFELPAAAFRRQPQPVHPGTNEEAVNRRGLSEKVK